MNRNLQSSSRPNSWTHRVATSRAGVLTMRSPDNNNRLPYDSLEMLFAFHVSEKARARREKYLQKFPENLREVEDRRYTLERAVKEVLSETAEVAMLIKELECQAAPVE